jgi:uncharacterized protein YbgA (DUF1722 family)/uncharacterized protein YbbK (DUF523 family)
MRSERKLRVGVSSCLLGQEVRWDGGHKRDRFLADALAPYVEWVPVCPEIEIGLGVPRPPIRLEGEVGAPRLVAPSSRADHTERMVRFAQARVAALSRLNLAGYVLKKDSPSCGMERVPVHARGGFRRQGVGLFARALMDALPALPVEEEGRLADARLRENFIERLFARQRWLEFRAARPTVGKLVRFHTMQKLSVLAHDPDRYRGLGRLVAGAKRRSLGDVLDEYEHGFMAALRTLATRGRHVNVLEHVLGHVSDEISSAARAELVDAIADYRRGLVPLLVPITLLRHHVRRLEVESLADQVYLELHPRERMLRDHV